MWLLANIMDCEGLEIHGGDYKAYNKINLLLF